MSDEARLRILSSHCCFFSGGCWLSGWDKWFYHSPIPRMFWSWWAQLQSAAFYQSTLVWRCFAHGRTIMAFVAYWGCASSILPHSCLRFVLSNSCCWPAVFPIFPISSLSYYGSPAVRQSSAFSSFSNDIQQSAYSGLQHMDEPEASRLAIRRVAGICCAVPICRCFSSSIQAMLSNGISLTSRWVSCRKSWGTDGDRRQMNLCRPGLDTTVSLHGPDGLYWSCCLWMLCFISQTKGLKNCLRIFSLELKLCKIKTEGEISWRITFNWYCMAGAWMRLHYSVWNRWCARLRLFAVRLISKAAASVHSTCRSISLWWLKESGVIGYVHAQWLWYSVCSANDRYFGNCSTSDYQQELEAWWLFADIGAMGRKSECLYDLSCFRRVRIRGSAFEAGYVCAVAPANSKRSSKAWGVYLWHVGKDEVTLMLRIDSSCFPSGYGFVKKHPLRPEFRPGCLLPFLYNWDTFIR